MMVCSFAPSRIGTMTSVMVNAAAGSAGAAGVCATTTIGSSDASDAKTPLIARVARLARGVIIAVPAREETGTANRRLVDCFGIPYDRQGTFGLPGREEGPGAPRPWVGRRTAGRTPMRPAALLAPVRRRVPAPVRRPSGALGSGFELRSSAARGPELRARHPARRGARRIRVSGRILHILVELVVACGVGLPIGIQRRRLVG